MEQSRHFLAILVLLLVATACAGSETVGDATSVPTSTTIEPASASAATGSFFAINEVGLGPNGYIAMTNFTDVPANLAGLYLCQASECFALPDEVVAPGETVRVAVGDGTGHEAVVATGASVGQLRPSDGEIALHASREIEDPKQMLIYLQWGSTPHEFTDVAVEAGLWIEGGYAPTSDNATRLYRVEESGLWVFDEP